MFERTESLQEMIKDKMQRYERDAALWRQTPKGKVRQNLANWMHSLANRLEPKSSLQERTLQ